MSVDSKRQLEETQESDLEPSVTYLQSIIVARESEHYCFWSGRVFAVIVKNLGSTKSDPKHHPM